MTVSLRFICTASR